MDKTTRNNFGPYDFEDSDFMFYSSCVIFHHKQIDKIGVPLDQVFSTMSVCRQQTQNKF